MSKTINTLAFIKDNIKHLPTKDITLAQQFLNNREFHHLQELVDSALYKINKSLKSDNPKEEYKSLDVDIIEELSVKIDKYIILVYGESIRMDAIDLGDTNDEMYEEFNDDLSDSYYD